jgi:cytoskeletal protein CcmA (bactofilin family)
MPTFDPGEALSLIDRYSYFEGTYRSKRDLRIEGEVRGTIECQGTLHVAEGAQVDAHVEAESITVAGELSGEIICRGRLQIMPSGRLHGKVTTQTLVINEGAIYEGELDMITPEPSKRLGPMNQPPRPLSSIASTTPAKQANPTPDTMPEPAEVEPVRAQPAPVPPAPAEPDRTAATATTRDQPTESPAHPNAGFTPTGKNASTFIRRLGGAEVPLAGNRDDSNDE